MGYLDAVTVPRVKVGTILRRVPRWRMVGSTLVEQKPRIRHGWGISPGGSIQDDGTAAIDSQVKLMQNMGAKWVRLDVNWSQTQSGGYQTWNWVSDYVIQKAIAAGMKVLAAPVGNPSWNRPSYAQDPAYEGFHITGNATPTPPNTTSMSRWLDFITGIVNHYKPMGVRHWEIRNEVNLGWNWLIGTGTVGDPVRPGGTTSPVEYATLYKLTHDKIKALDARAYIIPAGTSPAGTYTVPGGSTPTGDTSPYDWYSILYYLGCKDYMHALNHHPYTWSDFPSGTQWYNSWYQMIGTEPPLYDPSLRDLMATYGDSEKQIWCTEYGAPTNGPPSGHPVSEATQSLMLSEAMTTWASYDWAGPFFHYNNQDYKAASDATDIQDHFGLVRSDGNRKPAGNTFAAIAGGSLETPGPTLPPAGMTLKWSANRISDWDQTLIEPPDAGTITDSPTVGQYIRIAMTGPSNLAGDRCEIMSSNLARGGVAMGGTAYYEWEIYIPGSVPLPDDADDYSTLNQMKGDNFTADSHYNGGLGIMRQTDELRMKVSGGLYVGPGNQYQYMQQLTLGAITRDTWHKIGYHVKWDNTPQGSGPTGFARTYLNGVAGQAVSNVPTHSEYSSKVHFRLGWYPELVESGGLDLRIRNIKVYT